MPRRSRVNAPMNQLGITLLACCISLPLAIAQEKLPPLQSSVDRLQQNLARVDAVLQNLRTQHGELAAARQSEQRLAGAGRARPRTCATARDAERAAGNHRKPIARACTGMCRVAIQPGWPKTGGHFAAPCDRARAADRFRAASTDHSGNHRGAASPKQEHRRCRAARRAHRPRCADRPTKTRTRIDKETAARSRAGVNAGY